MDYNNPDKIEILNPELLVEDPTVLTLVLHNEDHTIGNSLKHILCLMPEVEFCGYNVPHPLEDKILVRIQTRDGFKAVDALLTGLDNLTHLFKGIQTKFEDGVATFDG
uniref:DNA-directed RNA polymerase I subunit D n=1 Tax=Rhabditophanes sp. KR3021 TaxID=114890 RepID=A0AC35U923_9BILA